MTEKEENIKEEVRVLEEKKLRKAEANRRYYEKYKEKIMEKVTCDECGYEYHKTSKSKHMNSKKHKDAEAKYRAKY